MSKFYPIGTVVKVDLTDTNWFMIAGYYPKRKDSKPFEYFAVPFPLGLVDETQYVCFNGSSITEVLHEGYRNQACDELLDGLDQFANNLKRPITDLT